MRPTKKPKKSRPRTTASVLLCASLLRRTAHGLATRPSPAATRGSAVHHGADDYDDYDDDDGLWWYVSHDDADDEEVDEDEGREGARGRGRRWGLPNHRPGFAHPRGGGLGRRGPSSETAATRPHSIAKLHPGWEGDCADLAVGACFGGTCGFVLAFTLARVASALALVASNAAFTAVVLKLAASHGFVTVHSKAIREALEGLWRRARALPVLRKLYGVADDDPDESRRRRRARHRGGPARGRSSSSAQQPADSISFFQALSDGGVAQIEELATRNEHAVLGVLLGFAYGFLRGA